MLRVIEAKTHLIAQSLISAAHQENSLVFAAMTRSLVEHLASLHFQMDRLALLIRELTGQSQPAKIDRILDQANEFAERSYYGENPRSNDCGSRAYPIADLMKSLRKAVPDIGKVYSYLSEFVHPNWGSNLFVTTGKLGTGSLNPPLEFHQEVLRKVCAYCILALERIEDTSMEATTHLTALQDMMDRASLPTASVASLFSTRVPKAIGDGRSSATAISFPTARTHQEAVAMIHRYLNSKHIEICGPIRIGEIRDGQIVEIFETSHGTIHFRTKTKW